MSNQEQLSSNLKDYFSQWSNYDDDDDHDEEQVFLLRNYLLSHFFSLLIYCR